ncbi:L,D-transpeptidase family protein [Granulosicoccaceae sp. 1_MG-2023]|nr:L,D-transpeptidase family protein [Granulosicoccaceae sp. 1_MG-2023]
MSKHGLAGLALLGSSVSMAGTMVLPPADVDLVGGISTATAMPGDTLLDIARQHGIGQDEIVLANPQVDRWLPTPGSDVVLPTRYILPDAKREGIVINLPEMRLYYYAPGESGGQASVITHPVSVGRMDWDTPLGTTRIIQKKENPTWTPPASIKAEHAAEGDPLPDVVPAGPDNPLGLFAMRLAIPGYLIHSTNKPYGVGMRVTHGCMRMYPEDIEEFFQQVPLNTPVTLVNQPIKAGWFGGSLYLEIHPPMDEEQVSAEALLQQAVEVVKEKTDGHEVVVRWSMLRKAVQEQSGIPVRISAGDV